MRRYYSEYTSNDENVYGYGLARPLVSARVCQDIILKVVITIKRMNKYEKRLNYFKN